MRIESAAVPAAPVPRRGKPEAAATTEPPAVAPTPKHGHGAEHRSDVATLRQWVNHPEQRTTIVLPDLTATHQGKGFAKAVSAYQAVQAAAAPPPSELVADPPPPVDPAPVVDPPPVVDSTAVDSPPVDTAPAAPAT